MFKYLSEILYLIGDKQRYKLPMLVILFIGLALLDLAGIGLIGPYVSLVIDPNSLNGTLGDLVEIIGLPKDREALLTWVGFFLVWVFFLKAVSSIWINWLIIRFSQRQQVQLRAFLMCAYQALPYVEYLRRNSAEYVYGILELAGRAQSITLLFLRTIGDVIVALVIISLLAFQNAPALVLLIGLLGITVFGYDKLFRYKVKEYGIKTNDASTSMAKAVNEGIEGLKEIRILGREQYFHKLVHSSTKDLAYFQTQEQVILAAPRFLLELLMITFIVLLVVGTIFMELSLNSLIPTLAMFGVAALRLLPITNMFSNGLTRFRFERDTISKLYSELVRFEQLATNNFEEENPLSIKNSFQNLKLDRVSFSYPQVNQKSLKDISLEIRAGESIALIGPSGSGKTTLVDLLLGLLEPQQGEVRYNGKSIDTSLDEWRSNVAYLPQQVFLIDNTVRCNVALGCNDTEIDDLKICESLKKAKLSEFVDKLPQGIYTEIGERGVRISGGQRQRIALARAFYHERNVLVLDEATSALDYEIEQEIVDEIKQLKGEKTMIVIAHRLSTVRHCDRIYKLNQGKIIECGTPNEIINFDDII